MYWIGFIFLLILGLSLFIGALLNLGGCGDRTGKKYKKSNVIQCISGALIFIVTLVS